MPTIYGYTDIQGNLLINGGITASQLKLTNGAQNGYILQSDGSGNATWISATAITNGYLPLAGGTMSANAIVDSDNSLVFRNATGSVSDRILLDPFGYNGFGTGIISQGLSSSDVGLIGLSPTIVSLGCSDGTYSSDIQLHNDGRLIRISNNYDRLDIFPTIISGSLTQMVREVTTGYTVLTTDATPTNCGQMEVLSESAVYIVEVKVIGREVYSVNHYGATLKAVYSYSGTGTMKLIGTIDKFERSTFESASCTLITDSNDVFVEVTGELGKDIQWITTIKTN